jgi:hypothetical protein
MSPRRLHPEQVNRPLDNSLTTHDISGAQVTGVVGSGIRLQTRERDPVAGVQLWHTASASAAVAARIAVATAAAAAAAAAEAAIKAASTVVKTAQAAKRCPRCLGVHPLQPHNIRHELQPLSQ